MKTMKTTTTTSSAPAPQSKPKLDFSSLTQASSTKVKAKSYPVYPGDDNTKALADAILETDDQIKAAKAANEIAKGDLIELVMPWWLQQSSGRSGVAGSVLVGGSSAQVLTTFKDQYTKLLADMTIIAQVIGEPVADELFQQRFKIEIDSDKVPGEKLQLVIDAVHQIATQLGVGDAITVKPFMYPNAGFNEARHTKLTVEQNLALEAAAGKRFTTVTVARKR